MKLNLLPATVSKGAQTKTAAIVAVLIALVGIGGAVVLSLTSQARLQNEKPLEADARARAQQAVDTAAYADEVVAQGKQLVTNVLLANAMDRHNDAYPALYSIVTPYIPRFYRTITMAAVPTGDGTAQLTITGTMKSYQNYADLILALMRIPGVTSVTRAGFQPYDVQVPPVTEGDQQGRPRGPEDNGPIPDDGLERLAYYQSTATTQKYDGAGNFGNPDVSERGAAPEESTVTVTINLDLNPTADILGRPYKKGLEPYRALFPYDQSVVGPETVQKASLQTPNPSSTIGATGTSGGGGVPGFGGAGGGRGPAIPGFSGGGAPAGGAGAGRKGGRGED
jgi:uncharacterized membrane protein YgcG